ncbi:hypothetical protein [Streptomyces nigra]|uniref:hypothetical protein n=1 Tax=Streptomyces nigra TaxID=1827580 RepID=UPI0036CB58A9
MRKYVGVGVMAGLMMISGVAAGTAEASSYATSDSPGVFTLCAKGGYDVYAFIPAVSQQHIPGLTFGSTPGIKNGTCASFDLGISVHGTAYIYDEEADNGINIKQIAQVQFDGERGLTVTALPDEKVAVS